MRTVFALALALLAASSPASAQSGRQASGEGVSSAQVGGKYTTGSGTPVYRGGKWIDILYGRPLKRGRDLWGSGATYGKTLYDEGNIWRAGANMSTRLKTEVPLLVGGKTIAPGEYTMFIDLKPNAWTLAISRWGASRVEQPTDKTTIWGAYGYTPEKDVVRTPMKLETTAASVEQLTWNFADITDAGGRLVLTWDRMMASVPFTVGK